MIEMKTFKSLLVLLFTFLVAPSFFGACNSAKPSSRLLIAKTALLDKHKQSADSPKVPYETRHYTQTLDHFNFNPESYKTFQQKYLVNDTYWGGKGAPIFVYTGNEGSIEMFAQNTGFMYDIAPLFKALLVFIEHRYYGQSTPFKDAWHANELGYLSTTQALADFATLIIDLKKNLTSEESPIVVFGGSYGGMLAAWFRLKYPHISIGALASSAPILQFNGISSQYSFYNIITNDYKSESENCYKVIRNSWKEMEEATSTDRGYQKLQKDFRLCPSIRQESCIFSLKSWIENALIYGAMTDYPTATNFLTNLPGYPVKQMCKAIDNPRTGNGTFSRLYGAMNIYYNYTGEQSCFDLCSSDASQLGTNQWYWQTCTELVLNVGSTNRDSIFSAYKYNYTEDAESCKRAWSISPRPHWITTEFGGLDIKRVLKKFASNIIFFNGLRDPWSGGGVLKSLSRSLVAIVAPQGAHHVDLQFSTKEDPKWLRKVRSKEIQIIAGWLKDYYHGSKR